jgi:hypothetical protein
MLIGGPEVLKLFERMALNFVVRLAKLDRIHVFRLKAHQLVCNDLLCSRVVFVPQRERTAGSGVRPV